MKRNIFPSVIGGLTCFIYMTISMVILPYVFNVTGFWERVIIPWLVVFPISALFIFFYWMIQRKK